MKKMFMIMMIFIWWLVNCTIAQNQENIWVGDIIFQEAAANESQGSQIDQIGYNVVTMHLTLAGKETTWFGYQSEILDTIKTLEELTKRDVIEMLTISSDKEQTLAGYLWSCQEALQKWESISAYMKQEMNVYKQDMQACINDKDVSDKEYFNAIERYDQNAMDTTINNSIAYEKCATENRIRYNAKTSLVQKMVFYLWTLQKKYDVLYAKQDILTQNFEIFRDNILPDLNEINDLLAQYTF